MSNTHQCSDACIETKRCTPKQKINCFACGLLCNLRCYNLTSQPLIDAIRSTPNAVFLCNSCRAKVLSNRSGRQSNGNRLSNSSCTSSSHSAPSVAENKDYMTKADYANLLKLHDNLNGQMNSINEIANKMHDHLNATQSMNANNTQHTSNARDPVNDDDSKSTKTTIENIFKLMLKFESKIESIHTTSDEKKSIQQIMNAFEHKHTNGTTTKPTNAALNHSTLENWSMINNESLNESSLGRPSVLIRQTIDDDIMDVLKSSDRITWDTLDLLNKAMEKQNEKLDSILLHIGIGNNSISSPLVDSIRISNQSYLSHAEHSGTHINHSIASPADAVNLSTSLIENINIQGMNDKINRIYDELIASLPFRLPQAGRRINQESDHHLNVSDVESRQFQPEISLNTSHDDQATPHNVTEQLSNSILAEELNNVNEHLNSSPASTTETASDTVEPPTRTNELRNEFHLSNVSKNTTREMILDYVRLRGVTDESHIKLTCLVPRNRDQATLTYLSYKIDTNDDIASIIKGENFWPPKTKFKQFVQKHPRTAEFSTQHPTNFHSQRHQTSMIRQTT